MQSESFLVEVWESYENNGEGCLLFSSKEAAENHDLFEVQFVQKVQVALSKENKERIENNLPVWS